MVLSIETIDAPTPEAWEESESVAQFYQHPDDYAAQLISEEIDYTLSIPLKEAFDQYASPGQTVLDLGCGPGTCAKTLGPEFLYTGVDTAKPMLESVLTRYGYKKGYWGRIEDTVPVIRERGEQFDWAVALSSLYYVADPVKVVHDLTQITTKGIVISLDEITDQFKRLLSEELHLVLPMFNHSDLFRDGATIPYGWHIAKEWYGHAWNSPRIGLEVTARVITLMPDHSTENA